MTHTKKKRRTRNKAPYFVAAACALVILLFLFLIPRGDHQHEHKSEKISSRRHSYPRLPEPGKLKAEEITTKQLRLDLTQSLARSLVENDFYKEDGKEMAKTIAHLSFHGQHSPPVYDWVKKNMLASDNPRMREVALLAMGSMQKEKCVGDIGYVLYNDNDPQVRRVAAYSMALAYKENKRLDVNIVDLNFSIGIGKPGVSGSLEYLASALSGEPSLKVRKTIVRILSYSFPFSGISPKYVEGWVTDATLPETFRSLAISSLSREPSPATLKEIVSMAAGNSGSPFLQKQALLYLDSAQIDSDAVDALIPLLEEEDVSPGVRRRAAKILERRNKAINR